MFKLYIVLAITVAASTIFITMPELLEHSSHYLHWLTIVVSGKHIVDEFAHAIPQKKVAEAI